MASAKRPPEDCFPGKGFGKEYSVNSSIEGIRRGNPPSQGMCGFHTLEAKREEMGLTGQGGGMEGRPKKRPKVLHADSAFDAKR